MKQINILTQFVQRYKNAGSNWSIFRIVVSSITVAMIALVAFTTINPAFKSNRSSNSHYIRTQSELQFSQRYAAPQGINPELHLANGYTYPYLRTQSELQFAQRYGTSLAANPELKFVSGYTSDPCLRTQSELQFAQQYDQ